MNECLTTPQHEKQIGYWVSEEGKCMNGRYSNNAYHYIIEIQSNIRLTRQISA